MDGTILNKAGNLDILEPRLQKALQKQDTEKYRTYFAQDIQYDNTSQMIVSSIAMNHRLLMFTKPNSRVEI